MRSRLNYRPTVRNLLDQLEQSNTDMDIQLFKFPGVMYFRPTGQSLAISG